MSETSKLFTPKQVSLFLNIFQYFYVASSVVLLLVFFITLARGQAQFILLPSFLITTLLAYGIYNKKAWLPFIVTLVAAFGIIRNLVQIPSDPFTSILFIAILTFESYFFNIKEVKHLFKAGKSTKIF